MFSLRVPDHRTSRAWQNYIQRQSRREGFALRIEASTESEAADAFITAILSYYRGIPAQYANGVRVAVFDFDGLAGGDRMWSMYVFFLYLITKVFTVY